MASDATRTAPRIRWNRRRVIDSSYPDLGPPSRYALRRTTFDGLPTVARARWQAGAKVGGERGIRTPGSLSTSTVFKTAALNHSAISPFIIGGGPCTPPGKPSLALAPFRFAHLIGGGPCWPAVAPRAKAGTPPGKPSLAASAPVAHLIGGTCLPRRSALASGAKAGPFILRQVSDGLPVAARPRRRTRRQTRILAP